MKLTIRMKLLGSFVLVLLLLVATSAVAIVKMGNLGRVTTELTDVWLKSGETIAMLEGDTSDTERLLLRIINEPQQSERDRLGGELDHLLESIETERKTAEPLLKSEEAKKAYQDFSTDWSAYRDGIPAIEKAAITGDGKQATALLNQITKNYNNMSDALDKLVSLNTKNANLTGDVADQTFQSGRTLELWLSVAAIVLAMLLVFVISSIISTPILRIAEQVRAVAKGDWTVEPLKIRNRDELGRLAKDFNAMTETMRQLFGQVAMTAHQVAATSEQLSASAEQTTQATEQIAEAIQLVTMGTEQQMISATDMREVAADISGSMQEITANIQTVTDASVAAASKAETGQHVIEQVITQMDLINDRVRISADVVQELGVKSTEIESITALITSIAAQTNLLALNAAIEAARAGEQGRGFAVVADEVRKLAEQSGEMAHGIEEYIGSIQMDIVAAVQGMEAGTQEVIAGIAVVNGAGTSFVSLQDAVDEVTTQIQEVSAAVYQMAASSTRVVEAIDEISQVAEEAAAGTQNISAAAQEQLASMEEIASSASALSQLAEELETVIRKFRL